MAAGEGWESEVHCGGAGSAVDLGEFVVGAGEVDVEAFLRIPVRPREAEGAEREELWRLANDNYNGYQVYQQRAGERIIPVVLLEPA